MTVSPTASFAFELQLDLLQHLDLKLLAALDVLVRDRSHLGDGSPFLAQLKR